MNDRIYQNSGPERLDVTLPPDAPVFRIADLADSDVADLESIVRDLAIAEPLVYDNDDFYAGNVCGACDARDYQAGRIRHEVSCLWRRACEWVASHPTDGDPA